MKGFTYFYQELPGFMYLSPDQNKYLTGLRYCFYIWCIFDNPDPIFTLQLVYLRKS